MSLQLLTSFFPTHNTDGLPAFPAIDISGTPGETVLTPEAGEMVYPHFIAWDLERRIGGWTCYFYGTVSGNTYFLTHFGSLPDAGKFGSHAAMGTVGAVPRNAWGPHIHEGLHQGYYAVTGAPARPGAVPPVGTSPPERASHAPGAWHQLTRALGRDLGGSLYTTKRIRHELHRRVR